MDVITWAEKLSPLGMVIAALVSGALGWWGWTWAHKRELDGKDAVIEEVRKQVLVVQTDRDYWRDQAIKGAETTAKLAEHQEQITGILEKVTGKVAI